MNPPGQSCSVSSWVKRALSPPSLPPQVPSLVRRGITGLIDSVMAAARKGRLAQMKADADAAQQRSAAQQQEQQQQEEQQGQQEQQTQQIQQGQQQQQVAMAGSKGGAQQE